MYAQKANYYIFDTSARAHTRTQKNTSTDQKTPHRRPSTPRGGAHQQQQRNAEPDAVHAAHADEHGRVHSRRLHQTRVDQLLHARDERARHDEKEGERGRVRGLRVRERRESMVWTHAKDMSAAMGVMCGRGR